MTHEKDLQQLQGRNTIVHIDLPSLRRIVFCDRPAAASNAYQKIKAQDACSTVTSISINNDEFVAETVWQYAGGQFLQVGNENGKTPILVKVACK